MIYSVIQEKNVQCTFWLYKKERRKIQFKLKNWGDNMKKAISVFLSAVLLFIVIVCTVWLYFFGCSN